MKLLVAAIATELAAFPEEIPGFDRLVTGPGKVKATYALTRALDADDYEEILVVGTAGAVSTGTRGVFEVTAAVQHDVTDLDGVVGQHVTLPARVETGATAGAVIATGDSFVDDREAVAGIRALGAELIDMETYVYIWVAQQFGVPIRVLRAVSDDAQDGATTTWDETVTACSAELYEEARRLGLL